MTSINTNQSAMVALDTLRGINNKLSTLNDQISTGKRVNSAKDNAAIWSIAKTMDSDVMSFKAVSDSLSLANSTIGVARTASESITDLLVEVKSLVTQSSNKNTDDRNKIAADITNLTNQIQDIVESAQFNGVNLLNDTTAVSYLSSFNRDATGTVATDTIDVNRQDLRVGTTTIVNGDASSAPSGVTGVTFSNITVNTGGTASGVAVSIAATNTISEGDNFTIDFGGTTATYTAAANDDAAAVIDGLIAAGGTIANITLSRTQNAGAEELTVTTTANADFVVNNGAADEATSTTTGGGQLSALLSLSVADETATTAALTSIESLIKVGKDASAALGSSQRRIEIQTEFVTNLTDSLKVGISTLTDADLSAASAELSALQVQQQLGLQSLSIANSGPQSVLALFR
ncbi:MAG: flagellin N-terminal helical domain-containing protein [Parvularcula sp.]